jgi:cobyrinic acid a,c-diamide synthase
MFPSCSKPHGILIAAPRSGSGKTLVTLGLLRALKRRGLSVQPFKCGPDYIDPAFHEAACGRPSYNLDSWAMDKKTAQALLSEANGADFIVIEALMGLFDGVSTPGQWGNGASADIAALAGLPVILVLDISGQSQTAAAVARGFAGFRPDVEIAGVILNRAGSERHVRLARAGFDEIGMRVFGAIQRNEAVRLPERHLGLVQAGELSGLSACLDALADLAEAHLDIEGLLKPPSPLPCPENEAGKSGNYYDDAHFHPRWRKPGAAGLLGVSPKGERGPAAASPLRQADNSGVPSPRPHPLAGAAAIGASTPRRACTEKDRMRGDLPPPGQRIALAQDAAFSFVYPHLLKSWREAGAEILPFSPLADEAPPASADVVWLPGGYPELHAGRLASSANFIAGTRSFAATKPVHGECGGYMTLGDGLIDAAGERHAMLGLLRLETSFAAPKLHLGYRKAKLLAACVLGEPGETVSGHEFHYSSVLAEEGEKLLSVTNADRERVPAHGLRRGNVTGSFLHVIGQWSTAR